MKPLLPGLLALFLCSIISCTKTTNVKTTVYDTTTQIFKDTTIVRDTVWEKTARNPIVGLWVGTFKNDGDAVDSFYYSYNIDSTGMMIADDINGVGSSASAAGPWQLNGTTFTATLSALNTSGSVQAVTATYDSVAGTLSGQVNFTQGSGSNATLYLIRVK
jgi:hypothetical protein